MLKKISKREGKCHNRIILSRLVPHQRDHFQMVHEHTVNREIDIVA